MKNAKTSEKVVVIGAGLGGLAAAISLAAAGFSVSVFEKNNKIGGKLNVAEKDGFSFDLGPSILTLPHVFEKLFASAGKSMGDYLAVEEVVPHWRNFFEDGTVADLTPDMRLLEKELLKLGIKGRQMSGFYSFLEYAHGLYNATEDGYFAKGLDTLPEVMKHYGALKSFFLFDSFRSMHGAVGSFVKNDKLADILDYFIKYVGSSPFDAPAVLNLLPYAQFGYGLWYVRGGMYNLASALGRLAEESGVGINLDSEVVEITKSGTFVTGIKLKNGRVAEADMVVSDMEVIPAYERLLTEDKKFLDGYSKFEPACSGLVLHLGVDKIYDCLAHHNFFYSGDSRRHFDAVFRKKELSADPTIYLVAPVKSDKTLAPAGCEIIKVLPHIPHIKKDNPFTGDDYNSLRERVLDKLERMGLKDLRKHIVTEIMWTPDDIARNYYSNRGAIYGVVSDRFRNMGFKCPKKSEKYKNLYFVGGSVNPGPGMPMAALSGMMVADKITGRT